MAWCANCKFNLEHAAPEAAALGRCASCDEPACYQCGCTQYHPCERQCVGGILMCGWQQPGLCNFCFWQYAREAYDLVNSQDLVNAFLRT
jgi:hypothetical protein